MRSIRPSPRARRLKADQAAMETLAGDSSILRFTARGTPPYFYAVTFSGPGTFLDPKSREVELSSEHVVEIRLGAEYPRLKPDLRWKTPFFHPNISESGAVCLGGYSTHWVPSVNLASLCEMLWDMLRYENFDLDSPFNRNAAQWARTQSRFRFPLDARSLRDRLAGRKDDSAARKRTPPSAPGDGGILFIDRDRDG
jgi:hypothetical protein